MQKKELSAEIWTLVAAFDSVVYLGIVAKFRFWYEANLSELINFYFLLERFL